MRKTLDKKNKQGTGSHVQYCANAHYARGRVAPLPPVHSTDGMDLTSYSRILTLMRTHLVPSYGRDHIVQCIANVYDREMGIDFHHDNIKFQRIVCSTSLIESRPLHFRKQWYDSGVQQTEMRYLTAEEADVGNIIAFLDTDWEHGVPPQQLLPPVGRASGDWNLIFRHDLTLFCIAE
jgi:hypothetical protein